MLIHLSPRNGLRELKPHLPPYRYQQEEEVPVVCFAESWARAAALVPRKRPDWKKAIEAGVVFVYVVQEKDPPDFYLTFDQWTNEVEVRCRRPVKVRMIGQIDFEQELVRAAFSPTCTTCGRPEGWCNEGRDCGRRVPSLKKVLKR